MIHILHYECSFLNLKNNLYYFCRKSNEHCLLINPKSHGTCGFTFHLGSGSAHRSVDPLLRVSAGEGAEGRPLWPRASLLYCCRYLSFAFPHDSEARQIDFHGRIKEQFFFSCFKIWNKYFHTDMSYDFFLFKTPLRGLLSFISRYVIFFPKNSPKFRFEGSDGWSSITVRCFAPAEVKASNPFWSK